MGSLATLWCEGNLLVDTTVYTLKQRYQHAEYEEPHSGSSDVGVRIRHFGGGKSAVESGGKTPGGLLCGKCPKTANFKL